MSIKKRILTISGVVVLLGAIGAGTFLFLNKQSDKKSDKKSEDVLSDEDLEQIDYVNDVLEEVRTSKKYTNKDDDAKLELMRETVEQLAKEGKIDKDSIYCDEEEHGTGEGSQRHNIDRK